MSCLPTENQLLLTYVMHLLLKISQSASTNGMDSKNIAICVGPNLIWPNTGHETTNVGEMCLLIIFFIDYCQQIFGTELPALYQQAEVQLRIDMDRIENTNSPICTKLDGPTVVENEECHRQLQEESVNMDCNLIATSVTDVSVTGWMDISIPILTPSSASPAAINTGMYNTLDNQVNIHVQSSPTSNDSYTTSAGSETGEEGFHNSQKNKKCQICPCLTPSSANSLAISTGMYNTLDNQVNIHVQSSPTSNDSYATSARSETGEEGFHNSQKNEECQICPRLTPSSASSLVISTGMYNTFDNQVIIRVQSSPTSNDSCATSAGSETGEEGFYNSQMNEECQICPRLTPSSSSSSDICSAIYNILDNQVIIHVQNSSTSNDSYSPSAEFESSEGFHNSQKNEECQIYLSLTPSSASSLAVSTGMYNTLENQIAIRVQNSPTSNNLYTPSTGSKSVEQGFYNSQKDEDCQVCLCLTLSSASSLAVSTGMYNTLENQVAIHFQNFPISNDLYAPSAGSDTGEEEFHNSQKKKECQICPHLQSNTDVQPDTVTTSQVKQLTEYFSKFEKNPISLDIGNTKARLGLIPQLSQKQKDNLSSTYEMEEAIQAPIRDNKRNTESCFSKKLPSQRDNSKITALSVAERREVWERRSRGGNIPTEENKSGSLNTGKEAGSSGDDSIY